MKKEGTKILYFPQWQICFNETRKKGNTINLFVRKFNPITITGMINDTFAAINEELFKQFAFNWK